MYEITTIRKAYYDDLACTRTHVVNEHMSYVLEDLMDGEEHTLAEMYRGERSDIPLYLALHWLIRDGVVMGIDPYSTESPRDHRLMAYRMA